MYFYRATFDKEGTFSYEKVFCPPSVEEINRLKSFIQSNICRHDEKTEFFYNCPYFRETDSFGIEKRQCCNSINWGPNSPCHQCFNEKKYNPQNAKIEDIYEIKDRKCR